jgi:hypothetical protein
VREHELVCASRENEPVSPYAVIVVDVVVADRSRSRRRRCEGEGRGRLAAGDTAAMPAGSEAPPMAQRGDCRS